MLKKWVQVYGFLFYNFADLKKTYLAIIFIYTICDCYGWFCHFLNWFDIQIIKLMTMEQSPKVKWYVESEIYLGFNLYLKVLSLVELTNGTPAYLGEIFQKKRALSPYAAGG